MTDEDLRTQIALITQEMKYLRQEMKNIEQERKKEHDKLSADVSEIKTQASRWKGAISVILGASGFMIAIMTLFSNIGNYFKGGS